MAFGQSIIILKKQVAWTDSTSLAIEIQCSHKDSTSPSEYPTPTTTILIRSLYHTYNSDKVNTLTILEI